LGHASEASCAAAVGSLPSVRQSSALVVGPIDFVRRAEVASETPKNNLERAAAKPCRQEPPRGPGRAPQQAQQFQPAAEPPRARRRRRQTHPTPYIAARARPPPRSRKTRKTAPKNNPETMARQPRIPMKSEIEQALLVLEHTERSTLVDCGADKRIRQLFKTTSTRRKAQDFDKSEMSPTKLAKLSHNQGRSALLGAEFCTDLVLETCDVEAAGALASTCGLARVRCEPKLKAWKTLRRKIQNADLGTIETILDKYVTSPRTMCWTLSRLSAMGGEGVAYEHGAVRGVPSRLRCCARVVDGVRRHTYAIAATQHLRGRVDGVHLDAIYATQRDTTQSARWDAGRARNSYLMSMRENDGVERLRELAQPRHRCDTLHATQAAA
jgi:hypothetical protein